MVARIHPSVKSFLYDLGVGDARSSFSATTASGEGGRAGRLPALGGLSSWRGTVRASLQFGLSGRVWMKTYHLYFLCSLVFDLAAVFAAFSNLGAMIAFLALGMVCATMGAFLLARERRGER